MGNLRIETITPIPPEVAVGAGTAMFVDGSCIATSPISELEIVLAGRRTPAMGWRMAEPGPRTGRGYWWAVLRVDPVVRDKEVSLELVARLEDGSTASADLGRLWLHDRRSGPDPAEVAEPSAAIARSGEPLVAICMATFEPELQLFDRQIASIRSQTHRNWICVISDDGSSQLTLEAIRRSLGDDDRFVLSPAPRNEGHYRNFERALMMVPPRARYVAFSDQDDRWDADKLSSLLAGLVPGSKLVYSDMRLVDERGSLLAETYWTVRRNNFEDFGSMVLANTVTGAAALFDAELLARALPFPPRHSALFHDHWIAQIAMTLGPLSYVDRPLYDYVQHSSAALGHDRANGRGRYSRPPLRRLGESARRLRAQGYRPAWRAPYFNVFCRVLVASIALQARCGDVLNRDQLAVLERISDSPRGIAWLLRRSFRDLAGADETLGRERKILAGFAWRRTALARRRYIELRRRLHEGAPDGP